MLKNYFKIAWRTIARHKVYTFINVLGLALGITACLVIYVITHFEFSFDTFHPDKERIYCIDGEYRKGSGEMGHWNSVYAPLPPAMRAEMSGLETVASFQVYGFKVSIPDGNKPAKKLGDSREIIFAEPQYFSIFKYDWLAGNPATSLNEPFKVVLTESKARKYFGTGPLDKMIGRTVAYDDSLQVSVSGIIKDWDHHTDLRFTDFISFGTITSSFLKSEIPLDNWGFLNHSSQAFVKLAKGVSPAQIDAQFPALFTRHGQVPGPNWDIRLKPLTGIHFNADYGGEYYRKAHLPTLYALMGIALFILIIAVINFINLSTAQSLQRAKEIGVRKVLGSGRASLISQFFTETFVLTLFAVLIALLSVNPVLAAFSSFIPNGVQFHFSDPATGVFILLLTLLTTLLAGFYPAKVLSAYLPVLCLKGGHASKGSEKWYLRKGLIVFQFTISLVFIIGTLVIGNQIRFMRTKDLGFRTDAIVTLRGLWNNRGGGMKVLAEKIKQLPGAEKVILEAFAPMGFAHMENSVVYKRKNEIQIQASAQIGNEDFIPFYQMKLLAGRNLLHSDSLSELVINETCSRALGFARPWEAIGKTLYVGGGNKSYPIVGVVADFHENSFHERIRPVYIAHEPGMENSIAIRLSTKGQQASDVKNLLSKVEQQWKQRFPQEPFSYAFLDESISWLYEAEQKTATLVNVSMFITIFISCMGLFGLALFTAAKRTKEIGIRKVLGASVADIAGLLTKDIVVLITVAILIASPVAWYFMHGWLQDFAYRITIRWWIFALAGLAALFVGLLTVGFQAIRAAVANPVKSLRSE